MTWHKTITLLKSHVKNCVDGWRKFYHILNPDGKISFTQVHEILEMETMRSKVLTDCHKERESRIVILKMHHQKESTAVTRYYMKHF